MRSLTLEWIERHPGRVVAGLGLLFAIAYLVALSLFPHGRIVDGDSIQYYAYLRSLAIDRDVEFTNEYEALYTGVDPAANVWLTEKTPAGRPPNMMSIGPAVLWSPAFAATYALLLLLRPFGLAVPLDGFAAPFPLSAGAAGVVYAALGAYVCYRACLLLFPRPAALWGTLVAWLASPALYYSVVSPTYSHAPSLFACALFCYVWLRTQGDERVRRSVWLGLLAGLAALVRWQDAIVLVLPGFELLHLLATRRVGFRTAVLRAAAMGAAAAGVLLPQLWAWRAIYGHVIFMPQGQGFMRWTEPALLSMLFSLRHGLFSWTPAVLLAVLGFPALARRHAVLGWSAVVVFLIAVYVNASVSDWWGGEAFGARRFIGYTVFFAMGTAALFAARFWHRRVVLLRWTAVGLVAYNVLFLLQYQIFMRGYRDLVPYPTSLQQVFFDRLILPWRLLSLWLNGW